MDDGQRALLPQRQERRQARVQAEEAVEIERGAIALPPPGWAMAIVGRAA